ncbi:MAG: molybdopterin-dependent oxidoreductase [Erythrobacter sp.]
MTLRPVSTIRTTCAYCGVGCGISATVTGERTVEISGDTAHPSNAGSLCSKGTHLSETIGLEGRLLHPMIGEAEVSWDRATAEVAGRMQACIDEHGPDSVAFYVSGQLLTEDYYIANKLMKGFIGSGNIDTNSRLCMASAVAAHNRAFGEDIVPCTYDDLDAADVILLVGSNTAWCHPVIWQRIERARATNGTRLVVIDPRKTETAEGADLHIPIAPDGDVALFNALLADMFRRGEIDDDFLAEHCDVPTRFWGDLSDDPQVDAGLFAELANLVVGSKRLISLFSQGANQSRSGTDKGNAIINLHLASGQINRAGAGPLSITGQPNAMGGREVGGLANMLACHLGFDEDALAAASTFWDAPNMCSGPGKKAVEMFDAVHEGRIKFIWVMATNPAVSMPNAGKVHAALERCPTVVVSDVMKDTDTGSFAHIRLPALGWGEKDGTVTNSERVISRQRSLMRTPGDALADWQIIANVAGAMGFTQAFDYSRPADLFREYAAMTALSTARGRKLDLTQWAQCSDEAYDNMEPFRWGGNYPLKDGFPTTNGRAKLVAVSSPAPRAFASAFPLRLNTGRYRDQWHTMTRTGLAPTLAHHRREPLLEVHPDDAACYDLAEGGLARVTTEFGSAIFRVQCTENQAKGTIFTPIHWTDNQGSAGRTGRLISQDTDPISGQPGFKDSAASIKPFAPDWRAFLVSRQSLKPDSSYSAISRIKGGWLTEFAGLGDVDAEAVLPAGQRSEVADMSRGMRRITMLTEDGDLEAALYITRSGELPLREWVAEQLIAEKPEGLALLAGRPSTPQSDRGPMVCVCHGVGQNQIAQDIEDGAADVEAVGACSRAGTNCGSCRPEIARMIAELSNPIAEAAE